MRGFSLRAELRIPERRAATGSRETLPASEPLEIVYASPPMPRVPCAICNAPTATRPENPFAPFCSARCKTVDLGKWLDGVYRVPVATDDIAEDGETPFFDPEVHS